MEKSTRFNIKDQSLFQIFLSIKDPRVPGRCLHPLINIMAITLCALTCGADSWKAIEIFGKKRIRWFKQFLDLSNGIPSHLTFARVFSLINPDEFQRCFQQWIDQICQLLTGDIVNIDGKTLKGSSHKKGNKPKTHIVNAFSPRQRATLGFVKTPDKSNEIKGIPILLKSLNLASCIITIDAMGTQKGIAKLIRMKRAHYVLALKKNHKRFHRKVESVFKQADQCQYQNMVFHHSKTKNYDHQRIEEREYTILPSMYFFKFQKDWADLQAIIRVKRTRHTPEGIAESFRYYITSLPFNKYKKMCESIREHWGIENRLHWKLDVGLREDQCPIYRGFADQNLAAMRKIVLQLLENDKTSTSGIALKRINAALDVRYLRKVVGF